MNGHVSNARRRLAVTAAGLGAAALLGLAGCGQGHQGGAAGGGALSTAPSAPPSSSAPPATGGAPNQGPPAATHGDPVAAKQVKNDSNLPDSPRVFTRDGGRTLGVVVEQKGCENVDAHLTDQSAQRVVMVVTTKNLSKPGSVCPMHVLNKPVTVHLAAPLGQRTVVLRTS